MCVGLSEEARADFRLMKDVAQFTRVAPESRMKSLQMFMSDLNSYESLCISVGHNIILYMNSCVFVCIYCKCVFVQNCANASYLVTCI